MWKWGNKLEVGGVVARGLDGVMLAERVVLDGFLLLGYAIRSLMQCVMSCYLKYIYI